MKLFLSIALLSITMFSFFCCATAATELKLAQPAEKQVLPYRNLVYTAADICEIRQRVTTDPRLNKVAIEFLNEAKQWVERSDAEISKLMPAQDALYAYGFAGDPKTDQAWDWFGRSGGMCSIDRPGQVRSPHTGDVYGIQKPGEEYYDAGDGWVRPSDGKRFYFKGVWNSYIVRQLHRVIDNLAVAYMLSGDEAVAHKALVIFDQLATLRANLVCDNGAIDLERTGHGYGCFSYTGNNANARMVLSALTFDLLARSQAAQEASINTPGLTKFENIKDNYFMVAERHSPFSTSSLQNHALSMLSNVIAQAVLFGKPDDLRYGIDGINAFLNGCVDRDGEYYEVSGSYNHTGRDYAGRMIMLLTNYDPQNYEHPGKFPNPDDYANKLQFGNDPRWFSVEVTSLYKLAALGRDVNYGDSGYDHKVLLNASEKHLNRRRATHIRQFYSMTTNPAWKAQCAKLYGQLPKNWQTPSVSEITAWGKSQWFAPENNIAQQPQQDRSVLLPGKLTALLRSGTGNNKRALFMRGGVANSHAHDDQMALILYANGMNLTGEYGYKLWGRPDHLGFGTRAISHKTVVVNEDLDETWYTSPQGLPPRIYKRCPGADVQGFYDKTPVQFVELSNPAQWNIDQYRRLAWLIDISDTDFYFVDMFRVTGGTTHDYAWNGPFLDPIQPNHGFTITGVKPQPVNNAWTLAGLNPAYQDATFDKPGQSWAERLVGNSGKIKDLGIPGEKIGYVKWCPPPKNGYGFIYDIKAAVTGNNWNATWNLIDDQHQMNMSMLNPDGQTVITGLSPTLKMDHRHAVAIARRTATDTSPLSSRFVNITQVAANKNWPVKKQRLLAVTTDTDPSKIIAMECTLADNSIDKLITTESSVTTVSTDTIQLTGERAFVRTDATGKVSAMMLSSGTALVAGQYSIKLDQPKWTASVVAVAPDFADNRITVTGTIHPAVAGSTVLFDSREYAHNEYYKVQEVTPKTNGTTQLSFGTQSLVNARVVIDSAKDTLVYSRWPNELASFKGTKNLEGHQLVVTNQPDKNTTLREYQNKRSFVVSDALQLKKGDLVEIRTIQPGDHMVIPAFAQLQAVSSTAWTLNTNQHAQLTLPAPGKQSLWLVPKSGNPKKLATARNGVVSARISLNLMHDGQARLELR